MDVIQGSLLKPITILLLFLLSSTMVAKNTVKLRPKTLTSTGVNITYQYDDQNRFTCIAVEYGALALVDSITYLPQSKGYILTRLNYDTKENRKKNIAIKRVVVNYSFRINSSQFVAMNVINEATNMTSRVAYSMNVKGKLTQIIWGDELESASAVAFTHDRRGNIQSCAIEKEGTVYSQFYTGLAGTMMSYDKENGIFKYVSLAALSIIYGEQFPYLFLLENNIVSLKAGNGEQIVSYQYNSDGYPIQITGGLLNGFTVTYERIAERKK